MNSKWIKMGVIAILTTVLLTPAQKVFAAEGFAVFNLPKQTKAKLIDVASDMNSNTLSTDTIKIESLEEMNFYRILSDKTFVQVTETGFAVVNVTADTESEVAGKVYTNSIVEILEIENEWTKIQSGNLVGYVKSETVITGKAGMEKAKALLVEAYPATDLFTLKEAELMTCFTVGETVAEEQARLAAEKAARIAAEQARIEAERIARIAKGKSIVDCASQYVGNPYVYGGTSLTNGIDCSGFVKAIYAKFGIHLPRTSTAMRRVGYAVSASEILPGDIVCYEGHVGIYAGNGKIVNAIDEAHGIGYSNVRFNKVITIRRMF